MSDSSPDVVQTVAKGRVLEVTLDNPPDNRITFALLRGLNAALDHYESDDSLEALVLLGSKTAFSKGFDLSALGSGASPLELRKSLVLSNALFSRFARSKKPTIAAISGACLGGGWELALACHFRLCSERARIGLPEIWIKLVPGLGGAFRLSQLVGPAKALELVALGDLINPEDALRMNLVNRIFPKAEFADRVESFLNALLMADRSAIREAIALVSSTSTSGDEDNVRRGLEAFGRLAQTWTPPEQ